jgi:squalene monooxygenase
LTIAADGYASKFRKSFHTSTPTSKSKFYALELHDAELPAPLHGHVLLGSGAPVLLYQIGTHDTRALIDVPENTPTASVASGGIKSHLLNQVLPTLPERVKPSFAKALEEGKLRSMPNSFLPSATNTHPGLLLLGDAMNMRHPLTGGGMTVALNDVVLLSTLLSPEVIPLLSHTPAILKAAKTFHWRRKHLTSVINILAQALYSLFAANDAQLRALQRGCFAYFQRGGQCVDGPVGLLAGIIRQPLVLIYHFFSVAVLAMWLFIMEPEVVSVDAPSAADTVIEKDDNQEVVLDEKGMGRKVTGKKRDWVGVPGRVVRSGGVLWKACVVLFPYIWSELKA